jgi:predicted nucleic acid-binding protein
MIQYAMLDTNVVVDFMLKRPGFAENAEKIFDKIDAGILVGCISSSAVTDVYFIVENKTNPKYARKMMELLDRSLQILPVIQETIRGALDSNMPDFEDAVQTAAAQDVGIDIVVTRDKTGFLDSGLQVYLPEEFLDMLKTGSS